MPAAPLAGRNVGELVELAPGMREARSFDHGSRRSAGLVEPVVSGKGIGLQDAGVAAQMLDRIARAGPRVAEQGPPAVRPAERSVVAHIDPGPPGIGLALGQHRHRRVVAVQAVRRQHMGRNRVVQRLQRHGAGTDLVGQGRQAEIDALACIAVALAVQRLMRAILLEQDHRQQVGAGPAPGRRVERRRRLGDPLASRQVNFSHTVWITFHWRGTTSSVSVTSSPIFESFSDPQHSQAVGAGATTRSRGKCSGTGCAPGGGG